MDESSDFLKAVLDTITDQIVVIDSLGNIVFVNKSWDAFGQDNACLIVNTWQSINYLDECDKAAESGDDFGYKAGIGIRAVILAEKDNFYFEYPCHSPEEKRWFMMRVTTFTAAKESYYVISHQNISERKLAEKKVLKLSRLDSLTSLFNRRYFNEFIDCEWKRCRRLNMPLSLAMIDLDHFKLLNDTYGHQAGDDCLKLVANVLKAHTKRVSDICVRYGGEEFVIVYGGCDAKDAKVQSEKLLDAVCELHIVNENSPLLPILTMSIGVVTIFPSQGNCVDQLIQSADQALYKAKENGRNQVCQLPP